MDNTLPSHLSPHLTEHINRFGNYTLDFTRVPAPLPITTSSMTPASKPLDLQTSTPACCCPILCELVEGIVTSPIQAVNNSSPEELLDGET